MSKIEMVLVAIYGTIAAVCLLKGLWPYYKAWVTRV